MVNLPHDTFFKECFSDLPTAAVQLKRLLPPAVKDAIDWETLKLCPSNFAAYQGELRSDLLYSCRISETDEDIYILFEHQSSPHRLMPYRLLSYAQRIQEGHLRQNSNTDVLPVVIPIVLHHGEKGWNTATTMMELHRISTISRSVLQPLVPTFPWILHDLALKSNEELLTQKLDFHEVLVSVINWVLRDARDGERFLKELPFWAASLHFLSQSPEGRRALRQAIIYLFEANQKLSPKTLITILEDYSPEAANTMASIAEQLRAEGRLEGKLEGQILFFGKQLHLKFGALSPKQLERLHLATEEELDQWATRLFTAETVDELMR